MYRILQKRMGIKIHKELIDNISDIISQIAWPEFLEVMDIMYPGFSIEGKNEVEILTLFVNGLRLNEFFQFAEFVRSLS